MARDRLCRLYRNRDAIVAQQDAWAFFCFHQANYSRGMDSSYPVSGAGVFFIIDQSLG